MLPLPLIVLALAALGSRKPAQSPTPERKGTTPSSNGTSNGTSAARAPAPTVTPRAAAQALADYLRGGGQFGTKARPSPEVAKAQTIFGLRPDGVVGPATRNAARTAGVVLPLRPSTRQPARLATSNTNRS